MKSPLESKIISQLETIRTSLKALHSDTQREIDSGFDKDWVLSRLLQASSSVLDAKVLIDAGRPYEVCPGQELLCYRGEQGVWTPGKRYRVESIEVDGPRATIWLSNDCRPEPMWLAADKVALYFRRLETK